LSFPGGKIEKEESYEKATIRELKEETGIITKLIKDSIFIYQNFIYLK